jgi:hypothetical protein
MKNIYLSVIVTISLILSVYVLVIMPKVDTIKVTEVTKVTEIPYELMQPQSAVVSAVGPLENGRATYSVKIGKKEHKAFISYTTLSSIKAGVGDTVRVEWFAGNQVLKIFAGKSQNNVLE